VNPRYGSEPGVLFYTHISEQYAPFHTKVINATVRDATHVLDGLLYRPHQDLAARGWLARRAGACRKNELLSSDARLEDLPDLLLEPPEQRTAL
jgi:Transposase and inactivated derivatives, TnpA family